MSDAYRKMYIDMINEALEECHDIGMLDLICKLLEKGNARNDREKKHR